jgi:hypothetical protein
MTGHLAAAPTPPTTGTPTACPHLHVDDSGPCLRHTPTGLRLPGTTGLTPAQCRHAARNLADLTVWASADPRVFLAQAEYLRARIEQAVDDAVRAPAGACGVCGGSLGDHQPNEALRCLAAVAGEEKQ